ncbi:hypothetical protein TNCV_4110541 [Trichonephila clavipes]|nr:hypothetical protein TNCV_4110541 [Trichonephila clavipes]
MYSHETWYTDCFHKVEIPYKMIFTKIDLQGALWRIKHTRLHLTEHALIHCFSGFLWKHCCSSALDYPNVIS